MDTNSKEFKDLRMELVHDTANQIDRLREILSRLDTWNQQTSKKFIGKQDNEGKDINQQIGSMGYVAAEYFREGIKKIQGSLDHFYTETRKLQDNG